MDDKIKILFVDDEKGVLDGLRRSLRGQRQSWDMKFANSSSEAIELSNTTKFDVIVSDMRIPGMSGAEILEHFAKQQPESIRIILSGHSDEHLIIKAIPFVHQFLSKPCESTTIVDAISRTIQFQHSINSPQVRELVANINTLPTLPAVYVELTELLKRGEATFVEIGDLIDKDPAICAKVLQLVNSAFFGLGRKISSSQQAASLLGVDTLKNLVLTVGLFSQFKPNQPISDQLNMEALYQHTFEVADMCKTLATHEQVDKEMHNLCTLSGLLHDIGKLVLINEMPEKYLEYHKLASAGAMAPLEAEEAIFGTDHGKVGAYLLSLWSIPNEVIEATAFHHDIENLPAEPGQFTPQLCTHVADALVSGKSSPSPIVQAHLNEAYISQQGYAEHLPVWSQLYNDRYGDES